MSKWLVLVLLFAQYCEVRSYKPVVIIHGILDTAESLNDLKSMIEKAHPGTNVTVIKLYPEIQSLSTPMWVQVNGVSKVLKEIMAKSKDGVHLIGFSQGGLVGRAVIESCNDHNVQNFISLSSPQMGEYGIPSLLAKFLPSVTKEYLYLFLYKKGFQDHLTIANYWNDPKHTKEYLAGNIFLPLVNNNNNSKFADKQKYRLQKENFSKLKNITVISGPQDGVIIPWQSALFGFYDASLNIVPMEKQKAYTEDWFGLGTLAKRKAIHTFMFENITHTSWHGSEVVFNKAIKQWLT
ncbi:lysosomal thioesterase PPT2-like isoform X1 [Dendronephthya gigantea]|uniref:lysosomal thioesterase PPT2-like isoform X1 n=1 Tax=Dendronephthya gigantea TaxID=151771 RepID=UPI00106B75CC|nr:lysosomal thioesterase PPT2-like isoform X1 [Dendronephthya gigantea]